MKESKENSWKKNIERISEESPQETPGVILNRTSQNLFRKNPDEIPPNKNLRRLFELISRKILEEIHRAIACGNRGGLFEKKLGGVPEGKSVWISAGIWTNFKKINPMAFSL